MEPISSPHNAKVVAAGRLHRARHRRALGLTIVEGQHVVEEAVAHGVALERMFALASDARAGELAAEAGCPLHEVPASVLARVAATERPAGPVAVAAIPTAAPFPDDRSVLVMVEVADPGNVGTLIRSAAAFGFAVAAVDGADVWSPKVVRSAAGAHFHTLVCEPPPPDQAVVQMEVATAAAGGVAAVAVDGPVVLYVGSEAHGLPDRFISGADAVLTIPMAGGTESLNAAVAGSIAMYLLSNLDGPRPGGH